MNFSVDVADRGLLVRVSGSPTEQECMSLLSEMRRRSAESNAEHALVEVQVAFGLDLVATMSLVNELETLGFSRSFKIALLLLDESAREAVEFAELAATNRGRPLRVFTDRASALAWLAPRAPSQPPH